MSRQGNTLGGLLDPLHADRCDPDVIRECQPVVVPDGGDQEPTYFDHERGARIEVVYMAWCETCGAADWGVV